MMRPTTTILIVEARFYTELADELVKGAVAALEAEGVIHHRLSVPGAFEIPAAISMAQKAATGRPGLPCYDGYVALGCVIRGETTHYDYVCSESARALQDLATKQHLAIGYGILTVENDEQAWARADVTRKNKGADAANACLRMIDIRRQFRLP
jgi:6,7-dimethyl-8-ribityllumazine synthase